MIFGYRRNRQETSNRIRTSEGELLEVKKGVVLDESGQPLYDDRENMKGGSRGSYDGFDGHGAPPFRMWELNLTSLRWPFWFGIILFALLTPVFFLAGVSIMGILGLIVLFFWMVRGINRLF